MPMERKAVWLLVADGARARLFSVDRRSRSLRPVGEWSDEMASGKGGDIETDRPGRTFDSAGQGRHAMEPPTPPKEVAKSRFLASVADRLEAHAKRREFDELLVFAAPRALGELRDMLDASVTARVVADEAKDLTQFSRPELEKALGDRFWPT